MQLKLVFFLIFLGKIAVSQPPPSEKWIKIMVSPDHADWNYKLGEKVKFTVSVFKNNVLLKDASIEFEIAQEKQETGNSQNQILTSGTTILEHSGLKTSGFLTCRVSVKFEGKTYKEWANVAYVPLEIKPTVTLPADFADFWKNAISENNKLPMDTRMTLLPERCTDKVDVYQVSLQNWKPGARLYGILCVPKISGKFPAVLKVPGAGIRPYYGDVALAAEGFITFEIGIHGISVIMPQQNYDDLLSGWNNQYWLYNAHDRDRYFYKRVILGCIKANDFLCQLPQWDGKNLGVMGSSQGGALSIITAGLDSRVTAAAPVHPAMCDMTGSLYGRAGGWPQPFADKSKANTAIQKEMINALSYFDAANFARFIKIPMWFSFGYNDNVCPPTSVYAAYNAINSSKTTFLALESAHWVFDIQMDRQREWMKGQLQK